MSDAITSIDTDLIARLAEALYASDGSLTDHQALDELSTPATANTLRAVLALFTPEDVDFVGSEAWLLLDEGALSERRRRMNEIAWRMEQLIPKTS